MTYMYGQRPARRSIGLAVAALVLGLASVLCLAGALTAVAALICGFMAISRANRDPDLYGGKGMAVTGVVTGILGLALTIVVVIGLAVFAGSLSGLGLSKMPMPVEMHDGAALMTRYFYDGRMGCRLRLPQGFDRISYPVPTTPGLQREIRAMAPGMSVGIFENRRSGGSFSTHVASERRGLISSAQSKARHVAIESEGTATVGGMSAYVINITSEDAGTPLHQRLVFVDGGSTTSYLLIGSATQAKWDGTLSDTFDSCFSTFERGAWAMADGLEPDPNPPAPVIPGARGIPGGIGAAPPMRRTYGSVDEALAGLASDQAEDRRMALAFLEHAPVDAAQRGRVTAQLERLFPDRAQRRAALAAYKVWATKENVPAVRAILQEYVSQDAGRGGGLDGIEERKLALQMLGDFHDTASAPLMAASMRNFFMRTDASNALQAIGPAAEDAVAPLVTDPDNTLAQEALKILAKCGTEKSVLPLQRAMNGKSPFIQKPATDALQELATRLNLSPEQYQYNLINRYTIPAPTGFTPDSITTPQTRQWIRIAPGRTALSRYTVSVKLVDPTYEIRVPMGPVVAAVAAGPLTFQQVSMRGQAPVHWQALDGEYLIELQVVIDPGDTAANSAMTSAAQRIRVKGASTTQAATTSRPAATGSRPATATGPATTRR